MFIQLLQRLRPARPGACVDSLGAPVLPGPALTGTFEHLAANLSLERAAGKSLQEALLRGASPQGDLKLMEERVAPPSRVTRVVSFYGHSAIERDPRVRSLKLDPERDFSLWCQVYLGLLTHDLRAGTIEYRRIRENLSTLTGVDPEDGRMPATWRWDWEMSYKLLIPERKAFFGLGRVLPPDPEVALAATEQIGVDRKGLLLNTKRLKDLERQLEFAHYECADALLDRAVPQGGVP